MALLFNWPRQSPYLSQLRKAKQKSGSSLDREKSLEKDKEDQSPIHRSFQLKRTQSAPEFNVPRELCQTYNARMDRAALAMGVCPGCKVQLYEDLDSPTRISECKNMRHFSCPKCHSEYDIHRPGDECTCAHLQHQRQQRHHNYPAHHHRSGCKSNTSPIHHSHPPPSSSPFPPPAPTSSPSSSPMSAASSSPSASGHHQTSSSHRPQHHHKLQHQHTTGQLTNAATRPAMKRRPFQKAYSIDVKDIYNMPSQPKPPGSDISE